MSSKFVAGEVVLVSSPVTHFVGEVSPDDSVIVEGQLIRRNERIETGDCPVGDDGSKNDEQQQSKTCTARQYQTFITTEHAKTAIEAMRLRWGKRWSKNIRVLIDRLRLSDLREACR